MVQQFPTSGETIAAESPANPLLVEVTRGPWVESRHRAAYALVDVAGRVVRSAGDIERPVYPRSAIKALQALAMIESGAAEHYGLSQAEIALACASHKGEARHVAAVEAWLVRLGLTPEALLCGPQPPARQESLADLYAAGGRPSALHNNCSGKHAGFLTQSLRLAAPPAGYLKQQHPVQQRVLGVMESMSGLDLGRAPRGIDGCGIPTLALPLGNLALAMARLGNPDDQPESRQAACQAVRKAVAAEPFMLGGTDDFVSAAMGVLGPRALVKNGAEGVFCASFPDLGLGLALKVDDGAGRAAEVLMGRFLLALGLLSDEEAAGLSTWLDPRLINRAGREVGVMRALGPERIVRD
ncbi:MAG: asparaginase [Rhodospirillales bacterium]